MEWLNSVELQVIIIIILLLLLLLLLLVLLLLSLLRALSPRKKSNSGIGLSQTFFMFD